jgi:hypothetical protein
VDEARPSFQPKPVPTRGRGETGSAVAGSSKSSSSVSKPVALWRSVPFAPPSGGSRRLGGLSPRAVRLWQLRDLARLAPESATLPRGEAAAVAVSAAAGSLAQDVFDARSLLARSRAPGGRSGATAGWTAGLENPVERLAASANLAGGHSSGGSPPRVRCGEKTGLKSRGWMAPSLVLPRFSLLHYSAKYAIIEL